MKSQSQRPTQLLLDQARGIRPAPLRPRRRPNTTLQLEHKAALRLRLRNLLLLRPRRLCRPRLRDRHLGLHHPRRPIPVLLRRALREGPRLHPRPSALVRVSDRGSDEEEECSQRQARSEGIREGQEGACACARARRAGCVEVARPEGEVPGQRYYGPYRGAPERYPFCRVECTAVGWGFVVESRDRGCASDRWSCGAE